MPEHTQTLVSALEYHALIELDRLIRMAMVIPDAGPFLAVAIQSLDQVRRDQGLPIPAPVEAPQERINPEVSALAGSLIKRAMKS